MGRELDPVRLVTPGQRTGGLRMEFGHHGSEVLEAGRGDFLYVPKGAVHREGNPSDEPAYIVVFRAGPRGESTFNVDGPAPGS